MALIRPLGQWPLLICGPMLRRVTPTSVAVFVATSAACTVEILLGRADGTTAAVASSPQPTRAVGALLHVIVCEFTLPSSDPLVPDVVYAYDIRMTPTTPAGPAQTLASQPGLLNGTVPLGYRPGKLPTFSLPPALQFLHIVHGSCRKPHGGGPDALAIVDRLISEAHDNQFIVNTVEDARRRPHQLVLTGDQIYADDVAVALLPTLIEAGGYLLGEATKERFGTFTMTADEVKPGWSRLSYLAVNSQLSSDHGENHLMYFAEFCAMYVMCWSDELWPRDGADLPTAAPLDLDRAYDPASLLVNFPRKKMKEVEKAPRRAVNHRARVIEFVRTLGRVRRALANVPTLMMFDDHEISDDWNLDGDWKANSRSDPALHRVVRNGLLSAAVFQGWGNLPSRFSTGVGQSLLELVTVPAGQLRSPLAVDPAAADLLLDIAPSAASTPAQRVNWDWTIDGPEHRIIALDSRTHRDYTSAAGSQKAGLLTTSEMQRQLSNHRPAATDNRLCFVVAPAPVLGHPLLEEALQPILSVCDGARAADAEAWSVNRPGFEGFMRRLADFGRVVLLSGDVHYAFTTHAAYFGANAQAPARIVQLCSSAAKNADAMTRAIQDIGFMKLIKRGWFGFSTPFDDDGGAELVAGLMAGMEARSSDILTRWVYYNLILRERLSAPPVVPDGPWFSAQALAEINGRLAFSRPDDWSYNVYFVRDTRSPAGRLSDAGIAATSSSAPAVVKGFVETLGTTVVGEPNIGQIRLRMINGQIEVVHRIHWLATGVQPADTIATYTEHIAPLSPPTAAERPRAYQ